MGDAASLAPAMCQAGDDFQPAAVLGAAPPAPMGLGNADRAVVTDLDTQKGAGFVGDGDFEGAAFSRPGVLQRVRAQFGGQQDGVVWATGASYGGFPARLGRGRPGPGCLGTCA